MKIKVGVLKFITEEKFNKRYAEKLRGFYARKRIEETLFHNHAGDEGVIYRMPKIQYKVVGGNLTIVGFNEGAELVVKEFFDREPLLLGDKEVKDYETEITYKEEEFCVENNYYDYRTDSYWLPINQKNYEKFARGELDLNDTLRNHIITNFKGLGITLEPEERIYVRGFYQMNENPVKIKNIEHICFKVNFETNVKIPNFMGIGRHTSIGYGNIMRDKKGVII